MDTHTTRPTTPSHPTDAPTTLPTNSVHPVTISTKFLMTSTNLLTISATLETTSTNFLTNSAGSYRPKRVYVPSETRVRAFRNAHPRHTIRASEVAFGITIGVFG